ncbi:MAG: trypsin-like peptidase domain-containing protein [Candidatus Theseobacter exili]|nr:trypsin-like peptidase domain-containing protein [Candidatus Theseobacter exili]
MLDTGIFFRLIGFIIVFVLPGFSPLIAQEKTDFSIPKQSVVKIRTVSQRPNYDIPWEMKPFRTSGGSGAIISGNRILTNAHVVCDARYIEVTREGDSKPYLGHVSHIGNDCDLAVVKVEDDSFFVKTNPLPIGGIPELRSKVLAYGYPIGGKRIAITEGVVSRMDFQPYQHSALDSHLILQIDASINPGSSGGPVVEDGKLVGIAFQSLSRGENVGYIIPTSVIRRFLKDIEDGRYDEYPELGIDYRNLFNPALKDYFSVPQEETGVFICNVLKDCSAGGVLEPGDVLIAINSYPVDDDGNIIVDGETYPLEEILERKYVGDTIRISFMRNGEIAQKDISLVSFYRGKDYKNSYDVRPKYCVYAGMAFQPLSREYLKTWDNKWRLNADKKLLYYYTNFFSSGSLYQRKKDIVVMFKRLPDPINTYYEIYDNSVVKAVDGEEVNSFKNFVELLGKETGPYKIIEFEGSRPPVIFRLDQVNEADKRVFKLYGIRQPFYLGEDDREVSK